MADEPTLGELGRRLDDRITDVRDDIAQLGRRIDDKVDTRIHQLQYDTLGSRLTALETTRAADAARVAATRRWLIGAVIVPIVAVVLAFILSRGGAG
jgi:t-SNARE complex subunit (syntaxin)